MGQNSSTAKHPTKSSRKTTLKLETLFTEPVDYSDLPPVDLNKRKSSWDRIPLTGPSKREINKAIDFVQDLLPLYIQQKENCPALTTSPLLAIDSHPLTDSNTIVDKRHQENFFRVVEATENNLKLGQRVIKKQGKNMYKRFSFANQKEELSNASKQFEGSSFSRQHSRLDQSTPDMSKNLENSQDYKKQDNNNFREYVNVQNQQYKIKSDLGVHQGKFRQIHGSFGQDDIEVRHFQPSSNQKSKFNKENNYQYGGMDSTQQQQRSPRKNSNVELRKKLDEEFNRPRNNLNPMMVEKTSSQTSLHQIAMSNNDWNPPAQNNNFYNTQPISDFKMRQPQQQPQQPDYPTQEVWRSELEQQQGNYVHPYSQTQAFPTRKNYYDHNYEQSGYEPTRQQQNHQENGRVKNPDNMTNSRKKWTDHSPNPMGKSKVAKDNSFTEHNKSKSPKSVAIQVNNNSRKATENEAQNRKNYKQENSSPLRYSQIKRNVEPEPTYVQLRQNAQVAMKKSQAQADKNPHNRREPLKNNNSTYLQPSASTENLHNKKSQKRIENAAPKQFEKDYYFNQAPNNIDSHADLDIKPISVDLNLDELLEAADKSMHYGQPNKNFDQNFPVFDHGANQINGFNPTSQQQQPLTFNGQVFAPKHLDDTAYNEEISQIEKKNNSMYLSRLDIGPEDIDDRSVDYKHPAPHNDSYIQQSNHYRGPMQNQMKGYHSNYFQNQQGTYHPNA